MTVLFTGLSGAGKSTVAKALLARLLEIGERSVTLLDGDVVRSYRVDGPAGAPGRARVGREVMERLAALLEASDEQD